MKIYFFDNFKRKLSIVSIFFAELFQFYIIFTITDIINNGINEENIILLIFNIFYILTLYFYNSKINAIFKLRGRYLAKDRNKMNESEKNKDNEEICKMLFEDILDGDFRP